MIRQIREQTEHHVFSEYASFSDGAELTRERREEPCEIRTSFQRDRDRILHSKAFRRLEHKTQVFLAPEGDHYRTRLTHTLEVAQIARTIARALCLNEDLAEAAALGHDLGHTPFGHVGEEVLDGLCKNGFSHAAHSLRIVEKLERGGQGLNLTAQVRDGIRCHQTRSHPATLEGNIVRISDKIAYINHDIDDAIRARIIREEDLPKEYTDVLGGTVRERLNCMIRDMIENSSGKNHVGMSPKIEEAMMGLRAYMFRNVYLNPVVREQEVKAKNVIRYLYEYYMGHAEELPSYYLQEITDGEEETEQIICDYIAGMTDRYAIMRFRELTIPKSWHVF